MDPRDDDVDRLRGTLATRRRQIAAVHAISRHLSSSLDLDDRLRDILTVSLEAVGAVAGTIFLHRPEDESLVFRYVVGEKASELAGRAISTSTGLAGAVFRSGRSQITNRPHETVEHDREVGRRIGFPTETMVTVPLRHEAGPPVGVMQILNKRDGEFDGNDLAVLEIVAAVAAAAIVTSRLAREVQTAAIARAVGDLSHDIKNKLAPIVVAAHVLRGDLDAMFVALGRLAAEAPPEVAAFLDDGTRLVRETYGESFDLVTHQVEAVQQHTKLIADALQGVVSAPRLEPCNLAAVVEEQLAELDVMARHRGVALHRRVHGAPRCRVDRFHVERAVYNLVDNAIAATPAGGGVTVSVGLADEARFPGGRCVEIAVADTGVGMPAATLAGILRGEPTSTKPGGTGLGTRIVLNAAAAHRGLLDGETREGAGTVFRLRLPLASA